MQPTAKAVCVPEAQQDSARCRAHVLGYRGAVDIERLLPDELARLRAIRLRSLRDAPDAFASSYEETAARPSESWRQQLVDLATFVAVVNGKDVGIVRSGPVGAEGDAAVLLSMWVAPNARGTGVGDALVDAVVAWARTGGYARVLLDVADGNAAAIRLYARKGFAPTGRRGSLPLPRDQVCEHEMALVL